MTAVFTVRRRPEGRVTMWLEDSGIFTEFFCATHTSIRAPESRGTVRET
jgi:hypothetical protein